MPEHTLSELKEELEQHGVSCIPQYKAADGTFDEDAARAGATTSPAAIRLPHTRTPAPASSGPLPLLPRPEEPTHATTPNRRYWVRLQQRGVARCYPAAIFLESRRAGAERPRSHLGFVATRGVLLGERHGFAATCNAAPEINQRLTGDDPQPSAPPTPSCTPSSCGSAQTRLRRASSSQ